MLRLPADLRRPPATPRAKSPKPRAFALVLCRPVRPCYVSARFMNSHRFAHLALHALVIETGSRSAGL